MELEDLPLVGIQASQGVQWLLPVFQTLHLMGRYFFSSHEPCKSIHSGSPKDALFPLSKCKDKALNEGCSGSKD